jgi:hypothetical protein
MHRGALLLVSNEKKSGAVPRFAAEGVHQPWPDLRQAEYDRGSSGAARPLK